MIALSFGVAMIWLGYALLALIFVVMVGGFIALVSILPLQMFAEARGKKVGELTDDEFAEFLAEQEKVRLSQPLTQWQTLWPL